MFELYRSDKSGDFYFRLKAANGWMYASASGLKNGIASVQKNAPGAATQEVG